MFVNNNGCVLLRTSLVAQMVKRLSTMWETWVRSLGREDSLEKEMATHSSTLALKIPQTEELGAGYYPWGCKESGTTEQLHFLSFFFPFINTSQRFEFGVGFLFVFCFFCCFFCFWPSCKACGILIPWPGIKPVPPASEVQSLNHWTTRKVQSF